MSSHRISHGIPWRIPWTPTGSHDISHVVPWHLTWYIPWEPMGCHGIFHAISWYIPWAPTGYVSYTVGAHSIPRHVPWVPCHVSSHVPRASAGSHRVGAHEVRPGALWHAPWAPTGSMPYTMGAHGIHGIHYGCPREPIVCPMDSHGMSDEWSEDSIGCHGMCCGMPWAVMGAQGQSWAVMGAQGQSSWDPVKIHWNIVWEVMGARGHPWESHETFHRMVREIVHEIFHNLTRSFNIITRVKLWVLPKPKPKPKPAITIFKGT